MCFRLPLLISAVCVAVVVGCSGSGTVKIVPVMRADFTDTEPLIQNVPVSQAYWDIDDKGQLVVALKYHVASLLGPRMDLDWQMSLVLEGLPAGSSRLYNLRSDSVRIVQTLGADQRRSRGWSGVAVLHEPKSGRLLHGRFHANIRQQQFSILAGWSPSYFQAPLLVVIGEFEAVRNHELASVIRQETEAAGFDRKPITAARAVCAPNNGRGPITLPAATLPAQ